jgi:hypothetical protein
MIIPNARCQQSGYCWRRVDSKVCLVVADKEEVEKRRLGSGSGGKRR